MESDEGNNQEVTGGGCSGKLSRGRAGIQSSGIASLIVACGSARTCANQYFKQTERLYSYEEFKNCNSSSRLLSLSRSAASLCTFSLIYSKWKGPSGQIRDFCDT
jgi:hypothetical protein